MVDGAEVATASSNSRAYYELFPEAPLSPNTRLDVVFENGDEFSLTTGNEEDLTAPSPPEVKSVDDKVGCGSGLRLSLSASSDTAVILAGIDGVPGVDAQVHDATTGRSVEVYDSEGSTHTVSVLAIDFAGNVSEPSEAEVTFPGDLACNHTATASADPPRVSLLVFLIARLTVRKRAAVVQAWRS